VLIVVVPMESENEIEKLFFKVKPVRIMVGVAGREESYARKLSKDVGATYAHTVKVLNRMKDYELVRFEPKGRKKIVTFTEGGRNIVDPLSRAFREAEKQQKRIDGRDNGLSDNMRF